MTTLLHKNVQNITLLLLHFFLLLVSFFGILTLGLYRVSSWLMISSSFIDYFILRPCVTSRLIMFQPFSMIFHVIPTFFADHSIISHDLLTLMSLLRYNVIISSSL